MEEKKTQVFTDGGAHGNPGPGGWAYVIVKDSELLESSGAEVHTTNNRMELTAAIRALERLQSHDAAIVLHTDSTYVQQGISNWIHNWKRKAWKTAGGKPVKNQDLWRELDELSSSMNISWKWVKGHAGNLHNERCDTLVQLAIAALESD